MIKDDTTLPYLKCSVMCSQPDLAFQKARLYDDLVARQCQPFKGGILHHT